MIPFGVFVTLTAVCLLTLSVLTCRLEHEISLPDSVVAGIVILILGTVGAGACAIERLADETVPAPVPVFIKIPTLVETK